MLHLAPIPAGYVIVAAFGFVLGLVVLARIKRRLRREIGRQLRQSFVAGFAAGTAAGFGMGRRFPPRPTVYSGPRLSPGAAA